MANCEQCKGLLIEGDGGEKKCVACGREYGSPQADQQGVVIAVELHPKTLKEMYGALALVRGTTPVEMFMGMGLAKGQARSMAEGEVVFVSAALALIRQHGVTPSDFVSLMEGQEGSTNGGATEQPGTPGRRGRKPAER